MIKDNEFIDFKISELDKTNKLLAYIESDLNKKIITSENMQIIKNNFRRTARLADEYKNLIKAKNFNK